MTPASSPASQAATALIAALITEGLTDVVVCPGARSQALSLAAWQFEQRGQLRLHVRIDERSASFFALGIGRETGQPAAMITTSGTAVANLMPAVLEAHHGEVSLILLTADRPDELRGVRANQTTVQPGIFDGFVRFEADIAAPVDDDDHPALAVSLARDAWMNATATDAQPGPVHLNLAYRVPLSHAGIDVDAVVDAVAAATSKSAAVTPVAAASDLGEQATFEISEFVPTVVVAGSRAGAAAEEFAHAANLPLLAEVTSGARFGREAITHYRELLAHDDFGGRIQRVIIFGVPTLTREVPQLVQRDGVETIVVASGKSETYNPGRRVKHVVDGVALGADYDLTQAHDWLGQWVIRDRERIAANTTVHEPNLEAARETGYKERNAYAKAEVAAMREPVTRAMLAEAIWRATWPHDRLVLGASKLIRVVDSVAQPRNIRVISNRGLAGIDGTISTAAGVAVASQADGEAGATRVLLGDLTALHDVGGLFWGAGEGHPRLQLFIGNDGGGAIFDALEVADTTEPEAFDRVMFTPQRVSFEHLAAAYGWSYQRVTNRGELDAVLTAPVVDLGIIEVTLQRSE